MSAEITGQVTVTDLHARREAVKDIWKWSAITAAQLLTITFQSSTAGAITCGALAVLWAHLLRKFGIKPYRAAKRTMTLDQFRTIYGKQD